ncbi:MAG: M48 family metallopeptidase [Calditrichaceae bacterium]
MDDKKLGREKLAKTYNRIKLIVSLSETLISLLLIVGFVYSGYSGRLSDLVSEWFSNPYIRLLAFLAIIGMVMSVISFPVSYFSGFWLEHYYKLTNQSLKGWILEKMKGLAVGLVLFTPILILFYFFLRNYPDTWWLWTATALFVFSVIIGRIAPQVIFPLFYKFEKLDNKELLGRMNRLAGKGKFNLDGVYRFNLSKTTNKANAAFTGFGKSKRIILGDTLLEKFSLDEIETVFAHEVGHYVHKHLLIGVITGTITSYLSLYIAHIVYSSMVFSRGFNGLGDLAALPLLSIVLGVISFIFNPLENAISRRHERQADRYALDNSDEPGAFIIAMQKLSDTNLSDHSPNPVVEFLFHSHPSVARRVQFAEQYLKS